MSNDQLKEQVVEILKRSHQRLVFLDSIICPVRKLIGTRPGDDNEMMEIFNHLKEKGIVESCTGFMSLYVEPHVYLTSFTLTREFFNKHCQKAYEQGRLF